MLAGRQKPFESIEARAPELAVARDPISGGLDSVRFEMKLMLPTHNSSRDKPGTFQYGEVLGDLSGRLGERSRERGYGLVASLTETREQPSP